MPKSILFVCVENAGRSQMAEAFFKKYFPQFKTQSAGTKPAKQVNPTVVTVLKEVGIDICNKKPKILTKNLTENSLIVNMGCIDKKSCPVLFVENAVDWIIPDPKGKTIQEVRMIRNMIESKVKELGQTLSVKT